MTDLSLGVVFIAFLSLPGIVGAKVYRELTRKPPSKNWEDFVEVLLFALFSYLVCYPIFVIISLITGWDFQVRVLETLTNLKETQFVFHWGEILFCCVIGLLLGFVAAFITNRKVIHKLGNLLGASKRYGDEDVWDFFLNSKATPSWVYVKDHKLNLLYFAEIAAFSDTGRDRELILENAAVYEIGSAEKLFSRDMIYLSRESFDLTIDIPNLDLKAGVDIEAQNSEESRNG